MTEDKNDTKEVSSSDLSKGITLTPALTDLFRPTTKLLGEELRTFAKGKIDAIKERNRDKNLKYHLEKVNEIVSSKDAEDIDPVIEDDELLKNAEKLVESLETVQDVDPSAKELSTIWQNLIASLRLGQSVPEHLISVIKTLSPLEASILIRISKREKIGVMSKLWRLFRYVLVPVWDQLEMHGVDKHYLQLLKDKRLLDKTYLIEYFWGSVFVASVSAYLYWQNVVSQRSTSSFDYPFPDTGMMFLIMFPLMIAFNVIVFGMTHGYGRYKLSWLGQEILKYAPDEAPNKAN